MRHLSLGIILGLLLGGAGVAFAQWNGPAGRDYALLERLTRANERSADRLGEIARELSKCR